jgi:hypothetical protein
MLNKLNLTAILAKAGVLEPLLKGISKINFGKVWSEFVSGDFGGAWNQLTKGFNLPSFSEALKNFFSGTSFFSVITRLLGVPLSRIIEFSNTISETLKKIKDFVDWIIGLFYKYVWTPLKGIWDSVTSLIDKIGGKSLSGKELKEAFLEAAKSDQALGSLSTRSPEGLEALFDAIASGDNNAILAARSKYGISDLETETAKELYNKLENPSATQTVAKDVTGALDKFFGTSKKVFTDSTGNKWNLNTYSDGSYKFRRVRDNWFDEDTADKDVPSDVLKQAESDISGRTPILKNALGGEVTKSGITWVDINEPIIPAEINRSSNLINLLETLASGNISNSKSSNIVINFDYTATGAGTGNGMYLDQFAFERKVKEIIGKCTRTYGSY